MFNFMKKKNHLSRNALINSVDKNKIWSKSLDFVDILNLLKQLENNLSKYDFELDDDFVMNGRRSCLRDMIFERLNNSNNQYEENVKESLFNLWEFISDEYDGNLLSVSEQLKLPVKEVTDMCNNYRKKNIICLQEKDIILEIIQIIKNYINEM